MREQDYQTKIAKDLTAKGWFVLNLIKTNKDGIPDLLALKKGHEPKFIECKTKKGILSPIQEYRLNQLTDLGFETFVSRGYDITKWSEKNKKNDTNLF